MDRDVHPNQNWLATWRLSPKTGKRNRTLIWPGLRGLEFRPVVRIIFAFSPLHHYTLLPEISTLMPSTVVSASFKRS